MATVRFSKELQDRILNIARNKMEPAVEKAKEQKPDNAWGQKIYDILFADVKPLLVQLPAGWLKMEDRIRINKVADQHCGMEFSFVCHQPWPVEYQETDLAKLDSSWRQDVNLKDHPVWQDFLSEVTTYRLRVRAAEARKTEFVESVTKVIRAYSTLAPALKAWPPLWELIPEDVKEKHREVKEREKKEVVLDVDIGKLTAMSTAAKMGL